LNRTAVLESHEGDVVKAEHQQVLLTQGWTCCQDTFALG
jgi:hypothetical protein